MPTVIALLSSLILTAHASEIKWEPMTTPEKPNCTAIANSCRLNQTTGSYEVSFIPKFTDKMKTLKSIQVKSLKDGKTENFTLEEMNDIPEKAYFALYRIKTRADSKEFDFALHAYNSAREGEVFYYFVFDPAAKKFVMSEGTFPKLKYDEKTKMYLSEIQGRKYVMGSDLKFTPAPN